jgi:hypothetical protein
VEAAGRRGGACAADSGDIQHVVSAAEHPRVNGLRQTRHPGKVAWRARVSREQSPCREWGQVWRQTRPVRVEEEESRDWQWGGAARVPEW